MPPRTPTGPELLSDAKRIAMLEKAVAKLMKDVETLTADLKARKDAEKTPHWKALVAEWFRYYGRMFPYAEPDFETGAAPSALKALMKKIKRRCELHPSTKSDEWTEERAVKWLRHFLDRAWMADNWYRTHFLLPVLNEKFDAIVDGQSTNNTGTGSNGKVRPDDAASVKAIFNAIDAAVGPN